MGNHLKVIEDFYEYAKEAGIYNGSFGEFDRILRGPFQFIKKGLTDGTMEPYRLQHFATFFIPKTRIYYSKVNVQKRYDEGLLGTEKYNKKMEMYGRYKEEDHY